MTDAQTPLPDPLTPPDCDLRDWGAMLLDVRRLRDSSMASHENPEVFRAAMLLWCASWHQVPAASLKDDDRELAGLAGFGRFLAPWQAVRSEVLRGFVKCSDGMLYHPVVAEKALEAWISKLIRRQAGARGNTSQGRAGGEALGALHIALGAAAALLREINPKAEVLQKDAVSKALCERDASGSHPPSDPIGHAKRPRSERNASVDGADSERIASPIADALLPEPDTHGVGDRTPIVDALRTQEKGRESKTPLPPLEGGERDRSIFDKAMAIYPEIGRGRTRPDAAWSAWINASGRAGGDEILLGCTERYAVSPAAKVDGGASVPAFEKWLTRNQWKTFLAERVGVTSWPGPAKVREAIIAHIGAGGEEFAVSWLDRSTTWSDVPQAIVCVSSIVEQRIRAKIGDLLARSDFKLVLKTSGEVAA